MKFEKNWSAAQDKDALENSCALNSIYIGGNKNIFMIIYTYISAKKAWETLEVAHEGTSKVSMSKLQLLTIKFENLMMLEEETIFEFNVRLCDIANSSFALVEKMSKEKLVKNILRYLHKRFDIAITTIKEAQDVSTMKVDGLIWSVLKFEMDIDDKFEKNSMGVTFKVDTEDCDD